MESPSGSSLGGLFLSVYLAATLLSAASCWRRDSRTMASASRKRKQAFNFKLASCARLLGRRGRGPRCSVNQVEAQAIQSSHTPSDDGKPLPLSRGNGVPKHERLAGCHGGGGGGGSLDATSRSICAPVFSNLSSSS